MLERNVEVGEDQPFGHQRDDLVDVRIGVDVVQPHPGAELAQLAREVGHVRADFLALPRARLVADVDAVGRRVLADHQQLLGARLRPASPPRAGSRRGGG